MRNAMIDSAGAWPRVGEIELFAAAVVKVVDCVGVVEHWNQRQSNVLLSACRLLRRAWPTQLQFDNAEGVFVNCGGAVNRALDALASTRQAVEGAQALAETQAELETMDGALITMQTQWTAHKKAVHEAAKLAAALAAAHEVELAAAHEAELAAAHATMVKWERALAARGAELAVAHEEELAAARAVMVKRRREAELAAARDAEPAAAARQAELAAALAAVREAARKAACEAELAAAGETYAAPAPRTNFKWTPLLLGTAATGIAFLLGARAEPASMVGAATMAAAAVADGGRVVWM